MTKTRVALISTGGTIEKTYCEFSGLLSNQVNVLDVMLASLELQGVDIVRVPLLNKDSLDMNDKDHELIVETTKAMARAYDAVVIVHGTDRLSLTGENLCAAMTTLEVPIVLTGAMRPYELRHTDAVQNLTEALLAAQILAPGVYVAMHNVVLRFPGVVKDRDNGTFIRA